MIWPARATPPRHSVAVRHGCRTTTPQRGRDAALLSHGVISFISTRLSHEVISYYVVKLVVLRAWYVELVSALLSA